AGIVDRVSLLRSNAIFPLRRGRAYSSPSPSSLSRLLQNLGEFELAADRRISFHRLEAGHDVHRGIAVCVKAPLTVKAVEILGGGYGSPDLLSVLCVGALDPLDNHLSGLPGVKGVRGRLELVAILVKLVDLCALSSHLLKGFTGECDAHINADGGITGCRLKQFLLEKAVGAHEGDLGCHHAKILHLPDNRLGASLDHGPHVDQVGTRRADLGENWLLVRLLIVDALVA